MISDAKRALLCQNTNLTGSKWYNLQCTIMMMKFSDDRKIFSILP